MDKKPKDFIMNINGLSTIENEIIKNMILTMIQSDFNTSLKTYLNLQKSCHFFVFKKIMNSFVKMDEEYIKIKDIPQIRNIIEELKNCDILQYHVICGLDETKPYHERPIYGIEWEWINRNKDKRSIEEIFEEYQETRRSFYFINEAIKKQDILFLQQNVSFLKKHDCYHWVISYFHLNPVPMDSLQLEKKRVSNNTRKTRLT